MERHQLQRQHVVCSSVGEQSKGRWHHCRRNKDGGRYANNRTTAERSRHTQSQTKDGNQRMGVPLFCEPRATVESKLGLRKIENDTQTRRASADTIPRPAPHLRNARDAGRCRCQNLGRYPWTYGRELHARHLHARDEQYAKERLVGRQQHDATIFDNGENE